MKAVYLGYIAASVYVCLPLIYLITAPDWHKTRTGRAMMMMLGSLAALFVLLLTAGIFGDYELRELVRYVIYGSVLVAGVRIAFLFFQLRFGKDGKK